MIIRKPYAFLIKNFKKIHVLLLLLSLFVAYKTFGVSKFVNDFMQFGVYDIFKDPITKYITTGLKLSVILIIIGSAAILFLLRYKQKKWKIYLIPIIEYLAMYFVLNMITGVFNVYNNTIKTTDVRMSRDLLVILAITQIGAVAVFFIRTFGLDKSSFDFKQDEEFLNLSEKDREEVEISVDIDKNSFKRKFKKLKRNAEYFYIEHKKICITLAVILVAILGYSAYKFIFITNKTYSAGDLYSANGYTINIGKVYYTNKDYTGNVITKKNDFVIANVEIQNNSESRTVKMENFHLKNGTHDYTSTRETYRSKFDDLGNTFDSVKELKRDEKTSFIIIYRVDKDLDKDRFVMYYQEEDGYLRKIKIKVDDISEISKPKKLSLGDMMEFDIANNPDTISFDYIELTKEADYKAKVCERRNCIIDDKTAKAPSGSQILMVDFGSEVYSSVKMLNYVKKYGKLVYVDSEKIEKTIDIESVVSENYYGKTLYLKVPAEVTPEDKLSFEFIIRNKSYDYKLN